MALLVAGLQCAGVVNGQTATTPPPATAGGGGGGASTGTGAGTGGGAGGTTTTPSTTAPRQTSPSQTTTPQQLPRPVFITGKVVLDDGTEPPDHVLIERLCAANQVRSEGYTDSKGRFSIQLGQSLQIVPDASNSMFIDGTQGFSGTSRTNSTAADPYFDCELRGRLPGYRSSTLVLAGRRAMDNPEVGTLVLYPMRATDGLAVSATSASASKNARKAFEKGQKEAEKQKWESAEKELRKAVELHPKYAEAWVALARTQMARQDWPAARESVNKAIGADGQFVYSYEALYQIDFAENDWEALADSTGRLLRLNPYEFPGAYYFNGVAQYQLKSFEAAQKSLEQAVVADKRNVNPKTHYVLGLVLVERREYAAASKSLTTFVGLAPKDSAAPKAQTLIDQIAKALGR
jgi:tetratricopeptide (TPR) repeat protein